MPCWCGGDLRGYFKHIRGTRKRRVSEPCESSRAANAAYHRAWRHAHPGYDAGRKRIARLPVTAEELYDDPL